MAFPEEFLSELTERNPIDEVVGQYVRLTRRGSNLFGLCPFHNEKTPSFSVAPAKGIYYCFGCHKGGGVINFIMEIESLDYPDAVRNLAARAGMEVPESREYNASGLRKKEHLWELCRDAARYYHEVLKSPEGQEGLKYLLGRGLTAKTIKQFGLGFAPNRWDGVKKAMLEKGYSVQDMLDAGLLRSRTSSRTEEDGTVTEHTSTYDWFRNRVMFPIIDVRGNVIGFGGRVMDGSEPKYLNSPESVIFNKRKNLFALNAARKTKSGMIVLTEGYMDTITMHQYGFDCAVASLGTSLTQEQAQLLSKYTQQMVLCYDGDSAGQNAAKRAIGILEKTNMKVRVLRMQDAKDPDEYLKKFGAERFEKLLNGSANQAEYRLDSIRRKYDLSSDDGKVDFLKEAASLIASMPNAIEREVYSARAAEYAGVSAQTISLEVDRTIRQRAAARKKQETKELLQPARNFKPAAGIRYTDVRSAAAEELLLQQLLTEPRLIDACGSLKAEQFSVPLHGQVFDWIRERVRADAPCGIPAMGERFSGDEVAHITEVYQKSDGIVNEAALRDAAQVIREQAEKAAGGDLMAVWNRRKDGKG